MSSRPPETAGQSLVEFALTLPILLLILLATFDMGRVVYAQNVITNAAREGARYGATAPGDTQGIQTQTESRIIGLDMGAVTVVPEQPDPNTIRVTVTYTFTAATPLIGSFLGGGGTIALQGVSTMRIEGAQ